MKNFKILTGSAIFALGFVTSIYAANPVTKQYVDLQIQNLQAQISDIQPGTAYTAGTGIGITGHVITNTSPGITYTAGTGISITGTTISATSTGVGSAEFICTIQAPNNSVPPGTAFTIDTQVLNTTSGGVVASAGNGGTVFQLATGTYVIDYEMSLGAAGSVALYTGAAVGSMALDTNTVAGSSSITTWIHGRSLQQVVSAPFYIEVSSVVGTAAVAPAGTDAGSYMIRITFLKIA